MIGGIDVRIPTRAGVTSSEVAVRAIRHKWPMAVFENGLTGDQYDRFWEIPFGDIEELFVYRDSEAKSLWDAEGAVAEASNSMIHIISDPDLLTLVIDEKNAEMEAILFSIRSGLSDEILCIPAEAA